MTTNWADLKFFGGGDKIVADRLAKDINNGIEILPPVYQIMRAFDTTKFDDVKVVILGQDPYPTKNHANGLAFSVNSFVTPLPKSLKNIYKELESDLGITKTCGSLVGWARQGVLLLNTVLTVQEGNAGSHQNIGWEVLTDEVITHLSSERKGIVFILWGKKAQEKQVMIDRTKHRIIASSHPSPFSARLGFFGSCPFSRTNDYLKNINKPEIDWR